jgi:hypothetical protein
MLVRGAVIGNQVGFFGFGIEVVNHTQQSLPFLKCTLEVMAIHNACSLSVITFIRSEWKSIRIPVVKYRSKNATLNANEAS